MNTLEKKSKISIIKNTLYVTAAAGMMGLLLPACSNDDNDKAHMNVRMTDAPANYNAVLIDGNSVQTDPS